MYPVKSLYVFILALIFTSCNIFAQDTTTKETEAAEFAKLLKQGTEASANGKYTKALEFFTKAEVLGEKLSFKDDLLIKENIGNTYNLLSNLGEALGYYQKALKLADKLELKDNKARILNNIGLLYAWEKDLKPALNYFERAYEIANKYNSPGYIKTQIAVNIAYIYNVWNDFDKARRYLKEVEHLQTTKATKQMWQINYAESLLLSGDIKAAEKIAEGFLNDIEVSCYVCVSELLSKIYLKQSKYNLAIEYAKKGLAHTSNYSEKINLYSQLAEIHLGTGEHNLAFKYKDSVILAKDSLSARVNRNLYESNKVKLKVQEYQNELTVRREKQSAERMLFIFAVVFVLIVFWFIYRGLKNRITKQKQEKTIAENEKKILNLELNNLTNNIAEKNRKLSAKALYLSGRNELIEEVIDSLSKIPEISKKKEVADYMRTLKTYIRKDDEWDDFITYFEEVNPVFIKTLNEKYPELNASDIRYLCYVYMNLDLQEIANIFNITYNAAQKRQRRIKEKMRIDKDTSLHEYLIQVF